MAGIKKTPSKSKKTKRKTSSKKKSDNKKKESSVVKQHGNFVLGQHAWFKTTSGDMGYGKITRFYLNDSHGPVIQFEDELVGGTRCCLATDTSLIPPRGGEKKLLRALTKQKMMEKKDKK